MATALHADCVYRVGLVKSHERKVKRQRQNVGVYCPPKCVGLTITLAENHEVNVGGIGIVPINRTEQMPLAAFRNLSKGGCKFVQAGDRSLADHLANRRMSSPNVSASAFTDLAAASA